MVRYVSFLCAILLASSLTLSAPAQANTRHGIEAVVNDQIITSLDLEERTNLIIATTGMGKGDAVRRELRPQILQALIEETLQMQEAKKRNVRVNEAELAGAIANIEKQQNNPPGSLITFLKKTNAGTVSFLNQLRAQILWSKLLSRTVAPQIVISDEEIGREYERMRSGGTVHEVLLSGILLPVASPDMAPKMEALARKLSQEIAAGASFSAIANQISSQGALTSRPVWVDVSKLEPAIASATASLAKDAVSAPVKTMAGYQLVKVGDRRTRKVSGNDELTFKQLLLSLEDSAQMREVDVLMNIAREIAKNPGKCTDKGIAGIKDFEGLRIDIDYIHATSNTLAPTIKPLVSGLKTGEVSEPFATEEGIRLLMLCEKISKPQNLPPREAVQEQLFREKFGLSARKSLRNLKRNSFIEIRETPES